MATAFPISPQALHQFSRPRTVRTSRLRVAAQQAHQIAYVVETRWTELPANLRDPLTTLVYDIIESPRGPRGVARKIAGSVILATIALRGETDILYEYLAAVRRLVNAVLGSIERDSTEYRQRLNEAVNEGTDVGGAKPVPEDVRGWLAAISAEAHREP